MRLPANHLVAALQEDIVLGRLAPGTRLVEEELAERFRTKRHVLREAFIELERFGLIERKPNRGASVRQLTPDDVSEHRAMLRALREGDRRKLIELCAAHLDISRQAYLETHGLRYRA